MDRKEFFSAAFKLIAKKGLALLEENPILSGLERLSKESPPVDSRVKQRPPGAASSEAQFVELCTGCDKCMIACPVNVVMIEDLERRLPLIYPEAAPCIHCEGYPCIQACPTGALKLSNGIALRSVN